MNFTESQQACIIIEKLCGQRQAGHFCDIVLIVRGQKFKAHRNVLAACSQYFNSYFVTQKIIKEKLTISYCKNIDAFKSILDYMYTGVIMIDKNNAVDLLHLANRFLIDKVKDYCEVYFQDHISTTNCFLVRDLALRYKLSSLQKVAAEFIRSHILEVLSREEILQFSVKKLESFLKDGKFNVPQQDLLNFFCKWVEHNESVREDSLQTLLIFIDWGEIDPNSLEEGINDFPLLKNNTKCLSSLISFLKDSNIPIKLHDEKFVSLKNELRSLKCTNKDDCKDIDSATDPESPPAGGAENHSPDDETDDEVQHDIAESFCPDNSDVTVEDKESDLIPVRDKKPRKSTNPRKVILSVKKRRRSRRSSVRLTVKKKLKIVPEVQHATDSELESNEVNSPDNDSDALDDNSPPRGRGRRWKKGPKWKDGIKCDYCCYIAFNSPRLMQHISSVHSKDVTFSCKVCVFSCKWNREYYSHMKTHYEGPPYKCEYDCDYTTDRIQLLLSHHVKHTDDRPFVCDQCGHKCRSQQVLEYHIRTHTGEKPFQCEQCERRFTTKTMLVAHLSSHRKDRPFLCENCGFSTKHKKNLVIHMRVHTGNVFHCEIPDCKYTTPCKSKLAMHHRAHSGIRSHICSYCGTGFVEKKHLMRHEHIHLNENPFKCDQCDYSSSRKDKLKEHFQKHHGENATSKGPYRPRKQRRLANINDGPQIKSAPTNPPQIRPVLQAGSNNQTQVSNSNNSSSCNSNNQPCDSYNPQLIIPHFLGYEQVLANHSEGHQLGNIQNYQAAFNQASNLPHVGPTPPTAVPAISNEIPTKFRSFMSFM